MHLIFQIYTGRFVVKWTVFLCTRCNSRSNATVDDYIFSGFWPGSLSTSLTYLFSEESLLLRHHIAHKCPGSSENMFVHTLEEVSKECGRVIENLNVI